MSGMTEHTCECEHERHFPKERSVLRDPERAKDRSHPGHKYMAELESVTKVETIYGTYQLCQGCEECFPNSMRKEE